MIPAEEELLAQSEQVGFARASGLAALRASAKRQGLWALGHPTEIGGGGVPFLDFVYLNEVIGRSELGQLAVGSVSMQDSIMLHRYGTDEQKRRWLEPMVQGEPFPSVGLTGARGRRLGSDPHPVDPGARRRRVGRQRAQVVHHRGQQRRVHHGLLRDRSRRRRTAPAVLRDPRPDGHARLRDRARHSDDGPPRRRALRDPPDRGTRAEGQPARRPRRGLRHRPEAARSGTDLPLHALAGQAQRAFELMCERANSRFAHGSLLSEKGEIQRYVAESAAQIQAHRLMTLEAARALDAGSDARVEISLSKFYGGQMLHDVIDRAVQVHGALGVTADTPLKRMYSEAWYARIYDGPDEVHRMVVARRLLKDPGAAPWA